MVARLAPGRRAAVIAAVALLPRHGRALSSTAVDDRYQPLQRDAALFDPSLVSSKWIDPAFHALVSAVRDRDIMETNVRHLVTEEAHDIFSFPLLTDAACDALIEEVENFQSTGLPARRPNSMNNYGLILNEIGLRPSLSALQAAVHPLARALFPTEGASFDGHHTFVVSYKPTEDRGLDMHTDDSDVTLNVCLGKDFEAAGLTFCGTMGAPDHRRESFRYSHTRGRALLHLGRRRHGADDISAGHRVNLIMWNWNQPFRQSAAYNQRPFAVESSPPDPLCVSWTHDRDFEAITGEERPEGGSKFRQTAWCPPPFAEYEGFEGVGGRYGSENAASPSGWFTRGK